MAAVTKADLEQQVEDLTAQLAEAQSTPPEGVKDMNIYERIAAITREAGALAPERKGGVPFAFRGIDGTVAHLTPFLNKYGVFIAPESAFVQTTPRELADGRVVKTSDVNATYRVFGPEGASDITVNTVGLADDFADRSAAQAQSVAYRVALLQLFHLPTHTKEPEEAGEDFQRELVQGPKATSGNAKIAAAQASAATPATDPAKQMRDAIVAAASAKGRDTDWLNKFAGEVTGKDTAEWWDDPAELNKILAKVNDAA